MCCWKTPNLRDKVCIYTSSGLKEGGARARRRSCVLPCSRHCLPWQRLLRVHSWPVLPRSLALSSKQQVNRPSAHPSIGTEGVMVAMAIVAMAGTGTAAMVATVTVGTVATGATTSHPAVRSALRAGDEQLTLAAVLQLDLSPVVNCEPIRKNSMLPSTAPI